MHQVMLSPYECANPNCTNTFPSRGMTTQDTGGISHIRHKGTWYTGYICKKCSSPSTTLMSKTASRNLKLATQIHMAERHIKEKTPWTQPKTKTRMLTTDQIQKREEAKTKQEFGWLNQWLNDAELKNLFTDHNKLREFASTYGYGKSHINQIIKHKQTKNEEMA